MRFIIIVAAIIGLTIALPASKSKRDAPYPAATLHETYGLPLVKVEEVHDTPDCVFDGRWIDDVHDTETLEKTVVIETPHTDYGLPEVKIEVPTEVYGPPLIKEAPYPAAVVEVIPTGPYPAKTETITHYEDTVSHSLHLPVLKFVHTNFIHTF
jgi:hypothetical protein